MVLHVRDCLLNFFFYHILGSQIHSWMTLGCLGTNAADYGMAMGGIVAATISLLKDVVGIYESARGSRYLKIFSFNMTLLGYVHS